jgi:hypothetical protein
MASLGLDRHRIKEEVERRLTTAGIATRRPQPGARPLKATAWVFT